MPAVPTDCRDHVDRADAARRYRGGASGRKSAPLLLIVLAGLCATTAVAHAQPADTTAPLVATGAAIDVHTHVASQFLTDLFTNGGGGIAAGADDLIARLDEANVARAVILSAAYFGRGVGLTDEFNVVPENDFVAAEVARYPDRLIGFCGINPIFPGAVAEVDRCLDLPGMIGVKLHLEASGVDLTNEQEVAALAAVFDSIAERDAPVLIHVSDPWGLPLAGEGLANLAAILESHPTVRVVHAHCAGGNDDDLIELWLRVRNFGIHPETSFVDVSACLAFFADAPLSQRELIVWRLRKWGIDRVLFGSDYFAFVGETPLETLDILTKYPFTQEELDTILANDGRDWLGQ
jgi:predicted TIM-barrel fold metal-dependent hydrolase